MNRLYRDLRWRRGFRIPPLCDPTQFQLGSNAVFHLHHNPELRNGGDVISQQTLRNPSPASQRANTAAANLATMLLQLKQRQKDRSILYFMQINIDVIMYSMHRKHTTCVRTDMH